MILARYTLILCMLVGCSSDNASNVPAAARGDIDAGNAEEGLLSKQTDSSTSPSFLGKTWTIQGTAVDESGNPVEDVELSSVWSSNGVYWDESGNIPPEQIPNVWEREGDLAVRPQYLVARNPQGLFELIVKDRPRAPVLAVNKKRSHGGVALVDREEADRPIRIELRPLVRVTAEVFCPELNRSPDFAKAEIYVAGGDNLPLTQCGTYQGKVSFLLPPGEYEIFAESDSPVAMMVVKGKPDPIPLWGKYERGKSFRVPRDVSEYDLGVLALRLPTDSKGRAVDITQFYGRKPPGLDISDALRAPKDVKLEDFRGKWVLVEFWALWCPSCIVKGLPTLSEFCETHSGQRDQFEILAICDSTSEGVGSFAELQPQLDEIRTKAWGGKTLPFPILLDNGSETADHYGIAGRPSGFLIDPSGNLVATLPDDALTALAKRLAETAAQRK